MKSNYISEENILLQKEYCAKIRGLDFPGSKPSYYLETYGCQMNIRDAETVAGFFEEMGFISANCMESADIIFFTTCCIRDHAEKKLMANIGALKERKDANPALMICIGGCMMQRPGVAEKIMRRFPFVDAAIGTNSLWRLPQTISSILEGNRVIDTAEYDFSICEGMPVKHSSTVSAFVNIMYGCDNFCSYCIVPYVRGRERSRNPEHILNEVRSLAAQGISEITLLGQNVNSYGNGSDCDFPSLLRSVNEVDGLRRIRFMTSHPKDLSSKLVDAMAESEKVCHHLHLPVQSGSNRILKEMNRKYTAEQYLAKVSLLRQSMPDIEITTDIIVGFPGETEEEFQDTLELVRTVGYSSAFTFKYSPRAGTRAASMEGQIPEDIKKERLARLNALQAEMTKNSNAKYISSVAEVLVEGADFKQSVLLHGRLGNFKAVYFEGSAVLVNSYCNVKITSCSNNSLTGELVL